MKKWIWLLILNFSLLRRHLPRVTLTAKLNRNPVPVGETLFLVWSMKAIPAAKNRIFRRSTAILPFTWCPIPIRGFIPTGK